MTSDPTIERTKLELMAALQELVAEVGDPSIADLRAEVATLHDEVKSLRALVRQHEQALAVGGVTSVRSTPDHRAVALRLHLWHEARLAEEGVAELNWRAADAVLGGGHYKAQIYDAMYRAADGVAAEEQGSCQLAPAPGFAVEPASERADGWTKLVCRYAEVPDREGLLAAVAAEGGDGGGGGGAGG